MKSMRCIKCGEELNDKDPRHKNAANPKEAIKIIASDHASKKGCDWPAANLEVVIRAMNR